MAPVTAEYFPAKANDEEYVRAGWGGRYLASDEEYEEVDSKTNLNPNPNRNPLTHKCQLSRETKQQPIALHAMYHNTKDKRSISHHIHEPEPEPEPKA